MNQHSLRIRLNGALYSGVGTNLLSIEMIWACSSKEELQAGRNDKPGNSERNLKRTKGIYDAARIYADRRDDDD
jgi:hypothetical protein